MNARPALTLAAAFLVVFVLGALAGAASMQIAQRRRLEARLAKPLDEAAADNAVDLLTPRLRLDEAQQARVREIALRHFRQYAAVRGRVEPELFAIWRAGTVEVMSVLSEEQREKYRRFTAEYEARHARMFPAAPAASSSASP